MDPGERNPAVSSIAAAICPDRNGTSGMSGIKKRAKRLACRLGLDANPLRRRTDKIATCLAAQLLLGCLVGAPLLGYSWAPSRWVAPDGRVRFGHIPVEVGTAAGRTVWIWVDAVGRPTNAPVTHRTVMARAATVAAVATIALLTVLAFLAWAGRKLLDRRRLADWELAWAVVGPQWTKRFRSRG